MFSSAFFSFRFAALPAALVGTYGMENTLAQLMTSPIFPQPFARDLLLS